ncbi:MAG: low molecular weight phosphotyrosine protein phosphatase [Gammaproteobacteria bacterium]|jgi:protein-tyrosine phosphatase|nr:low molecular weight phosphotyrosine protein phosphatase [Gammaproteobacteria bacterium]
MKFPWPGKRQPAPETFRVLVVCMGNICRSPMAEGVLRQRLALRQLPLPVEIDSAGTHGYHEGAPPDPRAQSAALRRGVDISKLRARRVDEVDFIRFDLVLAMDEDNRTALLEAAAAEYHGKIRLLLEFAPERTLRSIPDPYYGGETGFERVLDMVEESMAGLLDELERLSTEKARRLAGHKPSPG